MITSNDLISLLQKINLPADDFAVFGGGPMYAHGIKELGHDLDLIARGAAWEKALTLGESETPHLGGGEVVNLFDGKIEIFNHWMESGWDTDELIDTADVIDGIRWVSLENVLKWKKEMGREKDFEHIQMIEEYLEKSLN